MRAKTEYFVQADRKAFFGSFSEVWSYKQLLYFLVWRDVKVRYKQSVLGVLWAVLVPFFTMVIFTLFFGRLAKVPSDGIPYPIFAYAALLPWTYFASSLTQTGNCLITNTALVTKIYFPRIILAMASVASGLVDFAIASTLLFVMMAYYGIVPTPDLLLIPILMIPIVLSAFGIGTLLAVINVKYRDVKHTLPFLVQMMLFATPVIYPASMVPDQYRFVMAFNPMAGPIEAIRSAIIPERDIDWLLLGISCGISVVITVFALWRFSREEEYFADVV